MIESRAVDDCFITLQFWSEIDPQQPLYDPVNLTGSTPDITNDILLSLQHCINECRLSTPLMKAVSASFALDNPNTVMQTATIFFNSPHQISIHHETLPAPPSSHVTVATLFTAVSAGTELLIYNGQMPDEISTDALFPTQSKPFTYPSPYGYAAVGTVTQTSAELPFYPGQCVFSFHHHTSRFHASPQNLQPVPNGISARDAVFLPNIETAVSLAMDAAVLPGETVCVIGQGIVGLLLVIVLKKLHPYSHIVALETNPHRRQTSHQHANPDAVLDPKAEDFVHNFSCAVGQEAGADVTVEVSGAGAGLDLAIKTTRDYGRVVIGSWYGTKDVSLTCLGGKFHRSHIHLIASQVSHIPASLAGRWSKERRFQLAWQLLRDIRPAQVLPIHLVNVNDAPTAYKALANGEYLQVLFEYGNG